MMGFRRWRDALTMFYLIITPFLIKVLGVAAWAVTAMMFALDNAKDLSRRRRRKRDRLRGSPERTPASGETKDVEKLIVMHDWVASDTDNPSKLSQVLGSGSLSKIMAAEDLYTEKVTELLKLVNVYNFPIFSLALESDNKPLFIMLHHLSISSGLIFKVGIDENRFLNFIRAVELGYRRKVPFHNSTHAADVLHCLYYFLQSPVLIGVFSDLEILSMYIAAAVHDLDHPGIDNDFLVASGHSYAMMYNDHSVLENHHCCSAFRLMKVPECDFTGNLSESEYISMRKIIVEMVLATDPNMRLQSFLYGELRSKLDNSLTTPFNPRKNQEDKLILMRSIIRVADISNTTKNWLMYKEWTSLLSLERRYQIKLERTIGRIDPNNNAKFKLQLSTQCSSQKKFVQYVVYPIACTLCEYLRLQEVIRGMCSNLRMLDSADDTREEKSTVEKRGKPPDLETYLITKVHNRKKVKNCPDTTIFSGAE